MVPGYSIPISENRKILVTGGAGFVGANLIHWLIRKTGHRILNLDKLTYAGNPGSLTHVAADSRYTFRQLDIVDQQAVQRVISDWQPEWIIHLAAETHVDRSLDDPRPFVRTNVEGTASLLAATHSYFRTLDGSARDRFRFLHVSTDEVYGSLDPADPASTEQSPLRPRSPYAASKAAADHLVRAWHESWGLPVLITRCSNNYGPYQFPEKLIPLVILKALAGQPIPVYGRGDNIRDWLFVDDHVAALLAVAGRAPVGTTWNIGATNEQTNLDLVQMLCDILDGIFPRDNSYREQIRFVTDRPGHDFRYALDVSRLRRELDWAPAADPPAALRQTVRWYLENEAWWQPVLAGSYGLQRLGLGATQPDPAEAGR